MSYFNILGIISDGLYNLTATLYSFLGSLYAFIVDISTTDFFNMSSIEDFTRTVYVLAGVFMLFRIAISFLNTLIDPDKLTDKNEGAGNILKRLVIVVLLMVALVPNSYVYRFLDRLELAVIGEDGLISNLSNKSTFTTSTAVNKYINDINPFEDTYKKVDAAVANKDNTCDQESAVFYDGSKIYELVLYYGKGCSDSGYSGIKKVDGESYTYYSFTTGQKQSGNFTKPSGVTSIKSGGSYNFTTRINGNKTLVSPSYAKISGSTMILYGVGDKCDNCLTKDAAATGIEKATNNNRKTSSANSSKTTLDAGGQFAQSVLNTMSTCPEVSNQSSSECITDIKGNVLVDDKAAMDDLDDGKLSISWLVAIIVGIVVIVYLAILCVEVVVRSLKIMFLKMIAPVAIISYISPKDKVLGQWAKMYASTYLDLFIKLLAIKIGAELIASIKFSGSPIKDLILLLACLIFMKLIPTMISKIFGIDIASGSFKDSFNMLKAGVGATAGAALGGTVGALTGTGAGGRLSGAFRGIVGGAKTGYKGDILTGAKNTSSKNQRINTAKQQGLNFFDRATAVAAAKMGLPTAGAAAKDKLSKVNDVASANKDFKDWVEGEAVKKNARATDFTYKDANDNSVSFRQQQSDYNNLMQKSSSTVLTPQEQDRLDQLRRQGFDDFTEGVGVGNLQSKLDALENRDTSKMTDQELATHVRTLTETKSMLAAAKTSAAANYIKANANDNEIKARINKVNDAIAEARLSGADNIKDEDGNVFSFKEISLDNFDEKTIKNIKETAYGMKNAIGKEAEKELAKERYGNTNS